MNASGKLAAMAVVAASTAFWSEKAAAISVSAAPISLGAENLADIPTAGASTAGNVSFGFFVVESFAPPPLSSGDHDRPIILFDTAPLASLSGLGLTSASLTFDQSVTFNEDADVYTSELRMFSTSLFPLDAFNANDYAALTGDASTSFTTIGSLTVAGTSTGVRRIDFDAAGLLALEAILAGGDTTLGFTLREDAYVENGGGTLDGFAFQPSSVSLQISAVPLPAAGWMLLAGLSGLVCLTRRRRDA